MQNNILLREIVHLVFTNKAQNNKRTLKTGIELPIKRKYK